MAMKESGIEWVGLIPDTWSVIPNKYVMHKEKNLCEKWSGEDVMSLTMNGVIVRDLQNPTGKMPATFDGYQYIEDGDLLMCLFDIDVTPRCVGKVTHDGVTSPAYSNFKVHDNASRDYFYYYYLMVDNTKELLHLAKNLRHSFTEEQLGQLKVPMPSLSEQQAIADYLDETCSKIDEIIAEAKASIDEYKELKQSVIFEAVTKGLDKNVNVYKTGNSWIPSLPVGIKLSRFGLHHDIILGKMLCPNPRNEEDTLEPYYCAANVHFDGVTGVLKTMWFNSKEKETYVVHKNDMLIVEGGAGAGGAAIMNEEPPVSTFVQNSIMIVRSHMKDNRYSCYLVQALVKNKYVDVVCNKATIPHFTKEKVSYMPYPVFNRNERNEIANYLDERCKQIDSLIAEKESLIHDLEAYKKSLIYEVVTGKRRVV